MKSIYSFVNKESNLNEISEAVERGDYSKIKTKVGILLKSLGAPYPYIWNFKIEVDGEEKFKFSPKRFGGGAE